MTMMQFHGTNVIYYNRNSIQLNITELDCTKGEEHYPPQMVIFSNVQNMFSITGETHIEV